MKNVCLAVLLPLGILFLNGCANTMVSSEYAAEVGLASYADASGNPEMPRKLAWSGTLRIDVGNLSEAVGQATSLVKKNGGFIASKSDYKDSSFMKLSIPSGVFEQTVEALGRIGTVSYQKIQADDVTERYVDMAARLKTKQLLRDRLQALLDTSTTVKDTLAIEVELNRVQSDLDAMDAQMLQLTGRIQFATLDLTIELKRKEILGPLGYLLKGVFWSLEKLFVIQ